jgi:CDP-diacylglycerol--glycerol-3-phosphate 3-phosphatidyltransferase
MLDRHWRAGVERGLQPVGDRLRKLGVTPDALTGFGLLASAATAFLIGSGHLVLGVIGIAVSGMGDLLDGAVARRTGQATARGAFFDSVADRVSDALLLGGVAWYLATPQHPHLPVLVLAVAALSMVISYERAKAESLGLQAKGGLMERAERFVFLGVGCAFNILVPVLWVMLVLTALTAVQRFVIVWRQADRPVRPPRPRTERRERRPFASPRIDGGSPRLRSWWETRRPRDRTKPRHLSSRRRTRP